MYLAVPIALYVCERSIRAFRSSIKPVTILKVSKYYFNPIRHAYLYHTVYIVSSCFTMKVAVYRGNVLSLHMSKPQGFHYKSGQYMFVNCAAVSPFEWYASKSVQTLVFLICISTWSYTFPVYRRPLYYDIQKWGLHLSLLSSVFCGHLIACLAYFFVIHMSTGTHFPWPQPPETTTLVSIYEL